MGFGAAVFSVGLKSPSETHSSALSTCAGERCVSFFGACEGDVFMQRDVVWIFIQDGETASRRAGDYGSRRSAVLSPSLPKCCYRLTMLCGVSVQLGLDVFSEFRHREDAGEDRTVCLAPQQSSGMECAAAAWKVMCFQPCSPQLDVGTSVKAGTLYWLTWPCCWRPAGGG